MRYFSFILFFFFIQNTFAQNNKKDLALSCFKKAYDFDINQKKDSAYYFYLKAKKEYIKKHDNYNQARVLLNIANLQREQRDLIACENSLIDALKIFKQLDDKLKLLSCYNSLGVLLKNQEQFDQAAAYYAKALAIAKKRNSTKKELMILSNIAINYKEQQKYKEAIQAFYEVLKNDSISNYPIKKARAINYIAYCNVQLHDYSNLPKQFFEAKKIYKAQGYTQGLISNAIFLATFYLKNNQKNQAKLVLEKALSLAKKTNRKGKILQILQLLAQADSSKAARYFKRYTALNDSVSRVQLLHKNQFARISFESQEKEKEILTLKNKVISNDLLIEKQEKRAIAMLAIIVGVILLLIAGLFFHKTRQKQQRQALIIEKLRAKEDERNRLAGNVHDGLAGYLRKALNKVDNLNDKMNNTALDEIGNIIETAYNKARSISQEYQKLNFNRITFPQYIRSLVMESEDLYDITITTNAINSIEWSGVTADIKTEFYRALQEALINVHKHANATAATIGFRLLEDSIQINVKDNGIGADISKDFKSVGLANMESRINDLDGKIEIISSKNNGFELIISIPFNKI